MTAQTEVLGTRELADFMETLPGKIQKNAQRTALRAGAKVVLDEVKQRIPVASGELLASARITSRAKGADVSASVKVGNAKAWYAHLVEFGTRPHKISAPPGSALNVNGTVTRSVDHPGIQGRPFMRPAADVSFVPAIEAYKVALRKRLTKQGLNTPAPAGPSE